MNERTLCTKSDKILVEQLKNGKIEAYNALFHRYSKRLYYFALGYLKCPIEVEGLVQNVFVKVWERRAYLKPECSFKSYIFTIAFNFIKKVFIKRKKLRVYLSAKDDTSRTNYATAEQVDYDFTMNRILSLIEKMPERRKETFVKSRFGGLSVKEIAEEMDISPKTVENQITAALKFMRFHWNTERDGVVNTLNRA